MNNSLSIIQSSSLVPSSSQEELADQPPRLRYQEAFQEVWPEAAALEQSELLSVNISVTTAVTLAFGALPQVMVLRDAASSLGPLDLKHFDRLECYALAVMHTQGEYGAAARPPDTLRALSDFAVPLRDMLYSDATALSNRGLVSSEPLKRFKTGPGYKKLVMDLVGLSALLRRDWDRISSNSAVTMAELHRAEELSVELASAIGARKQVPAQLEVAAQQRQRVFTLFVRAYDQVRRAITFLRWQEGDVESIAPSLYSGRNNAHRKRTPSTSSAG